MKTKLFALLVALSMSTTMFAENKARPVITAPGLAAGPENVQISVAAEEIPIEDACRMLSTWLSGKGLEELTCTLTATVAIGSDKIFFKATVTVSVTGDCSEVIAELQRKIDEVKAAFE